MNWKNVIAVSCGVLCAVMAAIFYLVSHAPVSSDGSVAGFPIPLSTLYGILSSVITLTGYKALVPLLELLRPFFVKGDSPAVVDPPITPKDGSKVDPKTIANDAMNLILDLGTVGYHAGLYKVTENAEQKTKIRDAAQIELTDLFGKWFPETGVKA